MEFYSFYNRPQRKRDNFSNQEQKVYKAVYDSNGKRSLKVDKKVNIYDKIQEFSKDVSLSSIFSKYGLNIYDQLKKSEEQLIDLTNLPTNLMEAMTVIDEAKYAFDRQSKEIKAKFNNSFNEFIAASENGQLAQLLNQELKVSAEKFNTQNMSNYNNNINLVQHAPVQQEPINPTQYQSTQTQTIQQGVNLNV